MQKIWRKPGRIVYTGTRNLSQSNQYNKGRKQAIADIEFCIEESKGFFMKQLERQIGNDVFYQNLHLNKLTKVRLSLCKRRYRYFVVLSKYLASIRHYYTDDYRRGYREARDMQLWSAKSNEYDLDRMYPYLNMRLGSISTEKYGNKILLGGSYQYRLGEIDALNDTKYCLEESKKVFMAKINKKIRDK